MKTLFSDKVVAGLRKVPTAVWFLLLAASCFFTQCANLTSTITSSVNAMIKQVSEASEGALSINAGATIAFACIIEALLSAGINELIFYAAYTLIVRRFYCVINKKDFSFRLRILIIISNIIVGIFNIPAFFWKDSSILSACVDFIVPVLLVAWYYEDFRIKYVPKRNQGKLFKFASQFCLGIAAILKIIVALEYTLVTDSDTTAIGTASVWIDFGMVALCAVLAYINYKRLEKIAKEPEDNELFMEKEPEDNTIFKDFGF